MIVKHACAPHSVFTRLMKVQLMEVDHRVKHERKRFTGELHTTWMMYRAFRFSENPYECFLHDIVTDKLQEMIDNKKEWIVRRFLVSYFRFVFGILRLI